MVVTKYIPRALQSASLTLSLALLGACSTGSVNEDGVLDPFERQNRAVHGFNKGIDKVLLKPSSDVYGSVIPKPARDAVSNVASNLDMPRIVLNDLLQLRLGDALHNSMRLAVNTTFGLGGVLDPATDMGIAERDTDFGETLHVWGAAEGAYVELPVFGPSTERDAVGKAVDFVINPMRHVLNAPESNYSTGASIIARVGDRYELSGFVDEILYESADSYAQARLIYLLNRRFELGQSEATDNVDPYLDPYLDPYEQ